MTQKIGHHLPKNKTNGQGRRVLVEEVQNDPQKLDTTDKEGEGVRKGK
jgi:hypothetical protein